MSAFEGNRAADPIIRLRLFGSIEALSFSGESVLPRGRKAQAILGYLALSPDGAVPRQRLVDLLWSGRWGEQGRASLRQSLLELRAALGEHHERVLTIERDRVSLDRRLIWIDGLSRRDDEDPQDRPAGAAPPADQLLEMLKGLDPRFDAWIEDLRREVSAAFALSIASPHSPRIKTERHRPVISAAASATAEAPGDGLVLSVAPLIQVGSGAIDDYVAPALTQEILTALARFRWIQVRFSPSSEDRDAHYRLEGYIGRIGSDCRVVVRLIDQADRGVIVWTGSVHAPYPLQYEAIGDVVERVVEQLDPEILAIETRKALRRPAASPDSYECVLRATPLLYRFDQASWRRASELLSQATSIDPQHGRAFAFSALCRVTGLAQGWSDGPDEDLRRLDLEAAHAIACDPRDSLALALSGHIRSFLHHDFDGALALFEQAIRANPSCGFSWGYSSLTQAYLGETNEAMRRLVRAQAIMIHDPYSSFMDAFYAVITYFAGDWAETIDACRRQLERRPTFTNIRKLLIGALCFTDRLEEARCENGVLLSHEPQFTWVRHLQTYPFGRDQDRLALQAALQRAELLAEAPAATSRGATLRLVATNPVLGLGVTTDSREARP